MISTWWPTWPRLRPWLNRKAAATSNTLAPSVHQLPRLHLLLFDMATSKAMAPLHHASEPKIFELTTSNSNSFQANHLQANLLAVSYHSIAQQVRAQQAKPCHSSSTIWHGTACTASQAAAILRKLNWNKWEYICYMLTIRKNGMIQRFTCPIDDKIEG